jgi:hypothetical protein
MQLRRVHRRSDGDASNDVSGQGRCTRLEERVIDAAAKRGADVRVGRFGRNDRYDERNQIRQGKRTRKGRGGADQAKVVGGAIAVVMIGGSVGNGLRLDRHGWNAGEIPQVDMAERKRVLERKREQRQRPSKPAMRSKPAHGMHPLTSKHPMLSRSRKAVKGARAIYRRHMLDLAGL